jgi:Sigma-70 region 2
LTEADRDWLAERFEEHRTHLRAVGYRMLGSLTEADDAVQEAWLRLSRSDTREIENLGGWLPGGFFLEQRARIDFMGQQIDALELIGYDPRPTLSRRPCSPPSRRRRWRIEASDIS